MAEAPADAGGSGAAAGASGAAACGLAARVLVVDDDPPLRRMLKRSLAAEGFEVAVAEDGPAALLAAERSAPDVIVLDVSLPAIDGLAVCRRLRGKGVATPILMLTARDEVSDRVAGLQAGADDYLIKPFAMQELVARLHALRRRRSGAGPLRAYADLTLDVSERTCSRGGRPIELTGREAALLEVLIRDPGHTVTRERALLDVWGGAAESNVVDRYITRLRRKLGEPQLIRTVRGAGFVLRVGDGAGGGRA